MNNINNKYRPELRSYFVAYSIPTQQNFERPYKRHDHSGRGPYCRGPRNRR